jgi:adenylosuccinate lyase
MAEHYDHDTYLSPYTWRYGSPEMRTVWSEAGKRRQWRRIWVAMAEAQCAAGLVRPDQVEDLRKSVDAVDIERAHELEVDLKHDLMAEVHAYAEKCPVGGGIIHLGATSMDVEDNADALRIRQGLDVVLRKLRALMLSFCDKIEETADTPSMAFTHLQPAEPTTVGYRFSQYLHDLLYDYLDLVRLREQLRGKGFKGAVGTSASYHSLFDGTDSTPQEFEASVMEAIDLPAFPVATQTYARKQDYRVLAAISGLGQSLYKFAFDLRLLQSPPFGEWAEPFGKKQIGSSAMPFKRNPINAENVDSLARLLAALPRVAWDNAAHSLLERTLDDSGNRRTILPESFLIADECLKRGQRLIDGLRIDDHARERLVSVYGTFSATEVVLMKCVKRGGNRQDLHEVIREQSLSAWAAMREGRANPLVELLCADERILTYATAQEVQDWLDASDHLGDAPIRARALASEVRNTLSD